NFVIKTHISPLFNHDEEPCFIFTERGEKIVATPDLDEETRNMILKAQQAEITEHHVYSRLARATKDPENEKILETIASDELKHYEYYKTVSKQEVPKNKWTIFKYILIAKIFGLTFALKLMEMGEQGTQDFYNKLLNKIPDIKSIVEDEVEHEKKLISMINEQRLEYIGSIVLGLNDGLVEITGALAGFTFALQWNPMIAMLGLITGIAGALSMGASEYLSTKSEQLEDKKPFRAALFTGIAYFLAVLMLTFPFLLFMPLSGAFPVFKFIYSIISLIIALVFGILVIGAFTYYLAVVHEQSFKKKFAEMAAISLGIAAISFFIGMVLRMFFGVDI
ncbi:MAG: VIT1/CCC1 transporter family protein, partial [Candidatus Helarchaeales archaeon]